MLQIPWRIGVNMREFAYYELPECRQHPLATPPSREEQLSALQELRVPLIRFYAAHRVLDVERNLAQVGKTLDLLADRNMQAIVCLGDSIGDSRYTIPGDDAFHQGTPMGHFHKRYWNERHYEQNYLPYVRRLADRFGNHPAVLVWELGNELALHPRPRRKSKKIPPVNKQDFKNFIEFVRLASEGIKRRSPRKLISTGMINANQVTPDGSNQEQRERYARTLYGLPNIDLVSLHVYAEDDEDHLAMLDVRIAQEPQIDKPVYIGELGANIERTPDRPTYLRNAIATWKGADRNAFSVLLWAFDNSAFPPDSGVADGLAFARRHQQDFEAIKNIVREFGGATEPLFFEADLPPTETHQPTRRVTNRNSSRLQIKPSRFTKAFRVVTDIGVRIRELPTRDSRRLGLLALDEMVMVDPGTRLEADEHIWWEHERGWSAESLINGSGVSLVAVVKTGSGILVDVGRPPDGNRVLTGTRKGSGAKRFTKQCRVLIPRLFIRSEPDEHSTSLGSFEQGDRLMVDPNSRRESVRFIWWEHERGWSAESTVDQSEAFLFEIPPGFQQQAAAPIFEFPLLKGEAINVNQLLLRDQLFSQLPVEREKTRMLQHYGNTRFAFNGNKPQPPALGAGPYDGVFQGLHPGIDLGTHDADLIVPVYAGIAESLRPQVVTIIRDAYGPIGVRVKVGPYFIIYGHLRDDEDLPDEGTMLTAESQIGNIATRQDILDFNRTHPRRILGFQDAPHLHLEIRYPALGQTAILNPLLFLTDAVRETLTPKQPSEQQKAQYKQRFYFEPGNEPIWTTWNDPFTQPVIRLGGAIMGPRASLGNG